MFTQILQYPFQLNIYDCGIYSILYMLHLTVADRINHASIPSQYIIPEGVSNLNGFRLLLLEEMEYRRMTL